MLYYAKPSKEANMNNIFVIVGLTSLTYFLFKNDLSDVGFFALIYLIFMVVYELGIRFYPKFFEEKE